MGNIKSFRLDNDCNIKGMWALRFKDLFKDNVYKFSDKAKPGNIEISNGRITLDLNTNFKTFGSDLESSFDRIYGYLSTGLYVILENCFIINSTFSWHGYGVEKYLASVAYVVEINSIVEDFNIEEKIMATGVNFGVDYLDTWYNVDLPELVENDDPNEFMIRHSNKFFMENKYEILNGDYIVRLGRSVSAQYTLNKGVNAVYKPYISISTKDYRQETIETFLEVANQVLRFNDFLIQTFGKYTYFEFKLEDEENKKIQLQRNEGDFFYKPPYSGSLIFSQRLESAPEIKRNSLMLDDIKDDYGDLIVAWFENRDKLKYIIDLYYQNTNPTLDIETKLVNKIKMLESYYSNFLSNQVEFSSNNLELIEAKDRINNCLNESEFSEPIKEQIKILLDKDKKYSTLTEKLTLVLEEVADKLKVIFLKIDPEWEKDSDFFFKFSKRLIETRNFYTHDANEKRNKNRFTTVDEFLIVNSVLGYIIYYLVLKVLYGEGHDEKIFQFPFFKELHLKLD